MSDVTPRCPLCGDDSAVGEVNEPTGRWFCTACPMSFNGGGQEYLDMGPRRTVRQGRNAHPPTVDRYPRSTNEGVR